MSTTGVLDGKTAGPVGEQDETADWLRDGDKKQTYGNLEERLS